MAPWPGPLTPQRPGHQLSHQERPLWKGLATGEDTQSVPASPRSGSGAKASSQATAALLAQPPGTVKCTVIAARGQVLAPESHSASPRLPASGLGPFSVPSWVSDTAQTLSPHEETSRASQRLGEEGHSRGRGSWQRAAVDSTAPSLQPAVGPETRESASPCLLALSAKVLDEFLSLGGWRRCQQCLKETEVRI